MQSQSSSFHFVLHTISILMLTVCATFDTSRYLLLKYVFRGARGGAMLSPSFGRHMTATAEYLRQKKEQKRSARAFSSDCWLSFPRCCFTPVRVPTFRALLDKSNTTIQYNPCIYVLLAFFGVSVIQYSCYYIDYYFCLFHRDVVHLQLLPVRPPSSESKESPGFSCRHGWRFGNTTFQSLIDQE